MFGLEAILFMFQSLKYNGMCVLNILQALLLLISTCAVMRHLHQHLNPFSFKRGLFLCSPARGFLEILKEGNDPQQNAKRHKMSNGKTNKPSQAAVIPLHLFSSMIVCEPVIAV